MRWVFQHWYVINRPEQSIVCTSKYRWSTKLLARWRLRFVLHWNKTFGESWRRFPRLWPSKFFRCEFRKRLKLDAMDGKEPTESMFFYTENSMARWRFQFRSHRSQTFGDSRNNFPTSSALLFFFWIGFLEAKKMSSASATRRQVKRPKTKSANVWRAFDIWQGCLLPLKNHLRPKFQIQCSFLPRDERL